MFSFLLFYVAKIFFSWLHSPILPQRPLISLLLKKESVRTSTEQRVRRTFKQKKKRGVPASQPLRTIIHNKINLKKKQQGKNFLFFEKKKEGILKRTSIKRKFRESEKEKKETTEGQWANHTHLFSSPLLRTQGRKESKGGPSRTQHAHK